MRAAKDGLQDDGAAPSRTAIVGLSPSTKSHQAGAAWPTTVQETAHRSRGRSEVSPTGNGSPRETAATCRVATAVHGACSPKTRILGCSRAQSPRISQTATIKATQHFVPSVLAWQRRMFGGHACAPVAVVLDNLLVRLTAHHETNRTLHLITPITSPLPVLNDSTLNKDIQSC